MNQPQCSGSGTIVPMFDPSCESEQTEPTTEGYCWHCDAFAPINPVYKDEKHGWVATLKDHTVPEKV